MQLRDSLNEAMPYYRNSLSKANDVRRERETRAAGDDGKSGVAR